MDILKQIIEIDAAARERTEKVRSEQQKLAEQENTQAATASSAVIENAQKDLELFKAKMDGELSGRLSGAEKERAERCAELDRIFAENAERWREDIIKRITS